MTVTLLNADARNVPLADESVQCVITSPPYFCLRDYGTAKWEGGRVDCDHRQPETRKNGSTLTGGKKTTGHSEEGYRLRCSKCGAVRVDNQIGLEKSPADYVAELVNVFREVKRILRGDGVLWLNLGDSYAGSSMSGGDQTKRVGGGTSKLLLQHDQNKKIKAEIPDGLKPKDLIGIPWMVAFALRADGWYLRSDIIWAKKNPMPESVTDRPTKSHEYIFLLSKSANYFYDADAIKEPNSPLTAAAGGWQGRAMRKEKFGANSIHDNHKDIQERVYEPDQMGRNKRTVWTVATQAYSEAHFATFPQKLVEPMILAGSAPGDLVLDPFAGSGTVGRVCIKHQRRFVGLELNPAYIKLAENRTSNVQVQMI